MRSNTEVEVCTHESFQICYWLISITEAAHKLELPKFNIIFDQVESHGCGTVTPQRTRSTLCLSCHVSFHSFGYQTRDNDPHNTFRRERVSVLNSELLKDQKKQHLWLFIVSGYEAHIVSSCVMV